MVKSRVNYTNIQMGKMHRFFIIFLLLLCVSISGYAKGVLAGTAIANQADIEYTMGNIDHNATTNIDSFVVDRIVDLDISWQDTAPVDVAANEKDKVLTFLLTNLGNGDDTFSLTYEHNTTNSFTPPPENIRVYFDANGNGYFDLAGDIEVSDINISADENATLFIVSDIPDDNYTAGELSHDVIAAKSESNATVGADRKNEIDIVVRKERDKDTGEYIIREYDLKAVKKAVVHSSDNKVHTGTIITYSIDIYIDGNSTGKSVENIEITDAIPDGTEYQAGSLLLDSTSLTDVVDGDVGSSDGVDVNVTIGTIDGDEHKIVSFDVQVQ